LQEQRPDLNYSVLRAQGYTDQQMIDAFRPGPTVAAAERAGADKLKVDYNALLRIVRRGSAGEEDIARYAAETMSPVTEKLTMTIGARVFLTIKLASFFSTKRAWQGRQTRS
jgi:arginine/ornithine N-succinyltransferase beta subunit